MYGFTFKRLQKAAEYVSLVGSGIWSDSSIDLLKVGIPKQSLDAGIQQPHSRVARTFKVPP